MKKSVLLPISLILVILIFVHFNNWLYIAFYTSYEDRDYADVKSVRGGKCRR